MTKNLYTRCKIDEFDAVVKPALHDSNLLALDLIKDKEIILSFKLESGEFVKLYLDGVESFVCDNLRKGNIVLDFTITSGIDAKLENLQDFFDIPKRNNEKFNGYIDRLKQKVIQNELVIVELNPSYGCKLRALVESVHYEMV
ncbi:MAG: hypothetical protein ACI8WB_001223 [Phenylobacterium sp.]|jgi:hypothetical protein